MIFLPEIISSVTISGNRDYPVTAAMCHKFIVLLCLFSAIPFSASANVFFFAGPVQTFLGEHCLECHDGDTTKGDLRLDLLGANMNDAATAKRWEQVFTQLATGEMPPRKSARPDQADADAIMKWIDPKLASTRFAPPSSPVAGRLNRSEYTNTMRDLFGLEFKFGTGLPADDSAHGFDNVGETLTTSTTFEFPGIFGVARSRYPVRPGIAVPFLDMDPEMDIR